ncbi:chorismate mutase [Haloglycomyces albus]|uniref:chorismate mutase n=1 Tax=Haloglycomyces albus TaxID=526067 RepID=UPI00046CE525|nr:chorismate mutase [Haloglycomyces albus]
MTSESTESAVSTSTVNADDDLDTLRDRIDVLDSEIIRLWKERAGVSQKIGQIRMASGGTRLVLDRERAILDKFSTALGQDGTEIAMLILRAGRGPL